MSNFDMSVGQGIAKRIYGKRLNEVLYSVDNLKNNPGFASLKSTTGNKVKTPFGEAYAVAVQTGRGGSTSADIDVSEAIDADGTGSAPTFDQFLLTPSKLYTTYEVEGDVLDRLKDEGAFINASQKIVKDAMAAHVRKLCVLSHGTGAGDLAVITALDSSSITILPSFVRRVERYDRLVAAAAPSSGGLRSSTYLRVTKRNSVSGKITLSGDPTGLGWQVGDSIFWAGTRNAAYKGFFAWDPSDEADLTGTFFGVDRTDDMVRLGGNRFNATGITKLRNALIQASLFHIAEGATPTRVRVSPEDYATICQEGEALPHFVASVKQGETEIGFKAVMLAGVGPVVYDESMPKGHAMMEDESQWQMYSDDGNLVKIVSHDGLVFRKRSGDNWAITLKSLIQLGNDRPGHACHIYNLGS